MPCSVGEWVFWLIALAFPWLLARHRRRIQLASLAGLVNLLFVCSYVLARPGAAATEAAVATMGLIALDLAAGLAPDSLQRRLINLVRWPSAKIVLTVATVSLVPLGLAELACRVLTDLRVLSYHRPIQTVWRSGHDDWRLATITGDENREPDPVLLWRPADHKPYNAQRFKGPLAQLPKPADVIRVMCYGDSLTDGPPRGGWPAKLHVLLNERPTVIGRRFEVINAGVAGYSSHQGLRRFLQEVDRYQPDLLLVSFGWNDAAEAIGQPDKSFRIPPWPMVVSQRVLVRYRAYLVLMYYTRSWRAQPPTSPAGSVHPRVDIADYLANLDRFHTEAEARGIPIVFLTRPHKLPPHVLGKVPTWRGSVPRYNAALTAWARSRRLPLIDVQYAFEKLPISLFSDECHFTPQGYQRMAQLVCDRLLENPDETLRLAADLSLTPPASDPYTRPLPNHSSPHPRPVPR
jgi:lysophospholipase L1-like esterase